MTIKKACETFRVEEIIIRKSIRDGMLKKQKIHGKIEIPDDTKFIPVKNDIIAFLFQILMFKNNPSFPISRKLCPDAASLRSLHTYLFSYGFITESEFCEDISKLFEKTVLTNEGVELVLGKSKTQKLSNLSPVTVIFNPTIKVGLNIG